MGRASMIPCCGEIGSRNEAAVCISCILWTPPAGCMTGIPMEAAAGAFRVQVQQRTLCIERCLACPRRSCRWAGTRDSQRATRRGTRCLAPRTALRAWPDSRSALVFRPFPDTASSLSGRSIGGRDPPIWPCLGFSEKMNKERGRQESAAHGEGCKRKSCARCKLTSRLR